MSVGLVSPYLCFSIYIHGSQHLPVHKSPNHRPILLHSRTKVVNESRMMIPDTQRRLDVAVEELTKLVQEAEEDVKTTEVFKGALEALEAAKAATSS